VRNKLYSFTWRWLWSDRRKQTRDHKYKEGNCWSSIWRRFHPDIKYFLTSERIYGRYFYRKWENIKTRKITIRSLSYRFSETKCWFLCHCLFPLWRRRKRFLKCFGMKHFAKIYVDRTQWGQSLFWTNSVVCVSIWTDWLLLLSGNVIVDSDERLPVSWFGDGYLQKLVYNLYGVHFKNFGDFCRNGAKYTELAMNFQNTY